MNSDFMNSPDYYKAVEELLTKARHICLGLQMSINTVLPHHMLVPDYKVRASQFASQAIFSIAELTSSSRADLQRVCSWLFDVHYFLMTRCNPEDQTLSTIVTLCGLDQGTRYIMMENCCPEDAPVRADPKFPVSLDILEQALSQMAFLHDTKCAARQFAQSLDTFCGRHLDLYKS